MGAPNFLQWRNRCLAAGGVAALFAILALRLMQPVNLTAVDIGRHVKNGELILQGRQDVLYKNFYSFTHPDYPFINHHWLFGVVSYGLWKAGGFTALSIAYVAVLLTALWFFWRAAVLRGHFALAVFFLCLSLPLISDRREIRPEGVSMLLMGLYFYLLTKLSLGQIRRSLVFMIVVTAQTIWVNTHIFFFMGPLLIAVFLWEGASRGCRVCARHLFPLLGAALAVNVINPSGLAGTLTPLNIFKEFGYRLAENQNIFFMMARFPEKIHPYFLGLVIVAVTGMALAARARGWKANLPFIALTVFAMAAGLKAVRLMAPFGFFLVPLGAFFYGQLEGRWPHKNQKLFRTALLAASIVLGGVQAWSLRGLPPGLGLAPGVNASAEFFKQAALQGPVFSNYDIGGYLIYHLFPGEKVFVDNRQEAFPPEFFKDVYVPMQEDDKVWEKVDARHGFNAVYFYRHDLTPWGQDFLIKRVQDPRWAPVFVDGYTIIFLKRNARNQPWIERFELPKSMFAIHRT
ncbi:MAG: hypothetical protein HY591_05755 [Candidatus Omnitrophica bacterium]|nr:hypothetical protein [Candidatus Omnitrophota bacterium]